MRKYIKDVAEFMHACDQPVRGDVTFKQEDMVLRTRLVTEEANETGDAAVANNVVEIADGLADTVYVLAGSAVQLGLADPTRHLPFVVRGLMSEIAYQFSEHVADKDAVALERFILRSVIICQGIAAQYDIPFSEVWSIVQGANMAKVDPTTGKVIKDAGGKVLKPAGWQSPDPQIARLLHETGVLPAPPSPSLFD